MILIEHWVTQCRQAPGRGQADPRPLL